MSGTGPGGNTPPAQRARDALIAALHELEAQVKDIRATVAGVNDPEYDVPKQRIAQALGVADDLLAEHLPQPRRRVVQALDGLGRAALRLSIPIRNAGDEERSYALRNLRGALGQFRMALDETREQARIVYPGVAPIPEQPREIATDADRDAVQSVLASLNAFERAIRGVAREAATAPAFEQQGELVTGYIRSMAFSINLKRLLLTVNDMTLDLGALVSAIENILELTEDFRASVTDWFDRVTGELFLQAWELDVPLRRLVVGVRALGGLIEDPGDDGFIVDEPRMVLIQPGSFMMGIPEAETAAEGWDFDKSARPVHRVDIPYLFLLGKYPVTRGEYAEFARETNRPVEPPEFPQTDRHPAVNVSCTDAEAYAEWLSGRTGLRYRLPSEAEWEYACRAGTSTARYWGDAFDPALANDNGQGTTDVTAHPPNPWGLHDMLGNVFEWVGDTWHDDYRGAPTDGSAWTTQGNNSRVVRGGSWLIGRGGRRSGGRVWGGEGARPWVGFRLARTL